MFIPFKFIFTFPSFVISFALFSIQCWPIHPIFFYVNTKVFKTNKYVGEVKEPNSLIKLRFAFSYMAWWLQFLAVQAWWCEYNPRILWWKESQLTKVDLWHLSVFCGMFMTAFTYEVIYTDIQTHIQTHTQNTDTHTHTATINQMLYTISNLD